MSYARLVKCMKESAGKKYGKSGAKIGNAYLKWAFSESAALFLKGSDKRKKYFAKMGKSMAKGKLHLYLLPK